MEAEISKKNSDSLDEPVVEESCFICGGCDLQFQDLYAMHDHMRDHVEGGSYNYNYTLRTAFPVHRLKDASTQTLETDVNATENCKSKTIEHIQTTAENVVKKQCCPKKDTQCLKLKRLLLTAPSNSDNGTDGSSHNMSLGEMLKMTADHLTGSSLQNQNQNQKLKDVLHADKTTEKSNSTREAKIHTKSQKIRLHDKTNKANKHIKELKFNTDPHAKVECGVCGKVLKKMNLRTHRRRVHERKKKEEGPVNCEQCGRWFPRLRNLAMHRKTHKGRNLICCHCNHQADTHEDLIAHLKEHSETEAFIPLDDNEIGETESIASKTEHETACSSEITEKEETAEEPPLDQAVVESMNGSAIVESENILIKVSHGPNQTESSIHLDHDSKDEPKQKKSTDYKSDDVRVHCEKCGAATKKKYLRIHLVRYHNEPKRPPGPRKDTSAARHMKVECKVCGKTVKKMNLKTHHRRVHETVKLKDGGQVVCETCGKVFTTPYNLAMHRKIHTEKYLTCRHCKYLSSTHEEFLAHLNQHNKTRTFPCHVCSAVFSVSGRLTKHIRSVHMGEKRFFCDICSKGFYDKGSLDDHKVIHFEAKHQCSFCDRKFKDPQSKKRHEKTHLKDHKYICYICSHGFVQSGCYKSHMEKKHLISKEQAMAIHQELRSATKLIREKEAL